jgi:hypothetical protein
MIVFLSVRVGQDLSRNPILCKTHLQDENSVRAVGELNAPFHIIIAGMIILTGLTQRSNYRPWLNGNFLRGLIL